MDQTKIPNLVDQWFKIADEDLAVAKLTFAGKKLLHCCFHLQQTVEKSLKGLVLLLEETQPPYLHDLARLGLIVSQHSSVETDFKDLFDELNPFYIRARYPDYKEFVSRELAEADVSDFIARTEEFVKWRTNLKSSLKRK